MNFSARVKTRHTIAVLAAGWIALSGCSATDKQAVLQGSQQPSSQTATPTAQPAIQASTDSAQVSIAAPAVAALNLRDELVLEVTVRLHNPTNQTLRLFAGTPCAVFRWAVASAGNTVQSKPNQLCAQVVATDALLPYSSTEQRHEIVLDRTRYQSGNPYTLRYQFWRHNGTHEFTLTDIANHD